MFVCGMCVSVYVCMCVYVCVWLFVCVCVPRDRRCKNTCRVWRQTGGLAVEPHKSSWHDCGYGGVVADEWWKCGADLAVVVVAAVCCIVAVEEMKMIGLLKWPIHRHMLFPPFIARAFLAVAKVWCQHHSSPAPSNWLMTPTYAWSSELSTTKQG